MNGFINVLKAPGVTSSTVVSLIRHITNMKKVGHAGTLDPAAAGVLPIMLGKATKLFDYLQDEGKEYISEFVFGINTDTLDMQGKVIAENYIKITQKQIKAIIPRFIGEIKQFPPKVSAISINGRKAYDLQRQGLDFDMPEKEVFVEKIELIRKTGLNSYLFKIKCSKGTYIRSLCRDIASYFNTYGYVNYLNRIKSGYFDIKEAHSIEDLRKTAIDKILIPIDKPIEYMQRADLDSCFKKELINGIKIQYNKKLDSVFRVYLNEIFIGLGRPERNNKIQYIKVFKRLVDEEDI